MIVEMDRLFTNKTRFYFASSRFNGFTQFLGGGLRNAAGTGKLNIPRDPFISILLVWINHVSFLSTMLSLYVPNISASVPSLVSCQACTRL